MLWENQREKAQARVELIQAVHQLRDGRARRVGQRAQSKNSMGIGDGKWGWYLFPPFSYISTECNNCYLSLILGNRSIGFGSFLFAKFCETAGIGSLSLNTIYGTLHQSTRSQLVSGSFYEIISLSLSFICY